MAHFDLSYITAGSVAESASLQLYVMQQEADFERNIGMYELTRGWEEDFISWIKRTNSDYWIWEGGDYDYESTLDSVPVTDATVGEWLTFDVPVSVVQNWIDNPSDNYGLLLKIYNDIYVPDDAVRRDFVRFASSDNETINHRPKLELTIAPPE